MAQGKSPCPNCQHAIGEADARMPLDEVHPMNASEASWAYKCPVCEARMRTVVPFIAHGGPMWYWELWPGQVNAWTPGVGGWLTAHDHPQERVPQFVVDYVRELREGALAAMRELNERRSQAAVEELLPDDFEGGLGLITG